MVGEREELPALTPLRTVGSEREEVRGRGGEGERETRKTSKKVAAVVVSRRVKRAPEGM